MPKSIGYKIVSATV